MAQLLEVGCAKADITPEIGLPLSGYAIRMNRPSEYVDSPLFVHALVIRQGGHVNFLFSYDLLAISSSLEERLHTALELRLGSDFRRGRCVFVATHNHSAPTTYQLEGEPEPDEQYWQYLCEQTVEAAVQALTVLRPASLYYSSIQLPGFTYNRRALLADGRVSMARTPTMPVLERGPVDSTLTLMAWRDQKQRNIAVLVHFACHAAAMATQAIAADIPGEISRRMSELFDAPCVYLQGATGDVNALVISEDKPAMMAWVDRLWEHLKEMPETLTRIKSRPFHAVSTHIPLVYQPLPSRGLVERKIEHLLRIAEGDLHSPDLADTLILLSDLMNMAPGELPDPAMAAFCAQTLASAEGRILKAIDDGGTISPCPLPVALWSVGQVAFAFIAAEVFSSTGFKIRALGHNQAILPVTYASSIVGYLPDREAMRKGGYEVVDAWRFYRQPAPFDPDSEHQLVELVASLIRHVQTSEKS